MKKWFKKLLLIAIALLTVGSFASCSDDDDEDAYSNYKSLIIGSWKVDYEDGYSVTTFNQNGTGIDYEYDYEFGEDEEDFTWEIEGNKLYITNNRGTQVATINKLTKTTLILTIYGETTTAHRVKWDITN